MFAYSQDLNWKKIKDYSYITLLCSILILFICSVFSMVDRAFEENKASHLFQSQIANWSYDASIPSNRELMRRLIPCYQHKVYGYYENDSNYTTGILTTNVNEAQVLANSKTLRELCVSELEDNAHYMVDLATNGVQTINLFKSRLGYLK